jgi:hypothetical protein
VAIGDQSVWLVMAMALLGGRVAIRDQSVWLVMAMALLGGRKDWVEKCAADVLATKHLIIMLYTGSVRSLGQCDH